MNFQKAGSEGFGRFESGFSEAGWTKRRQKRERGLAGYYARWLLGERRSG